MKVIHIDKTFYPSTAIFQPKTLPALPVGEAADYIIHQELNTKEGNGGLIAVDKKGNFAMPFNSGGMFRGYLYKEKGTGKISKAVGIGKKMKTL
jgi:L-asparaginase / beta-aspartyl-peptidase